MSQVALDNRIDNGGTAIMLCAAEGSASHDYVHSFELNASPIASRNLADALHLFAMLHGAHHGLVELVAARNIVAEADAWLAQAVRGFEAERGYMAQLIVAAGPAPSTPGDATTSATVLAQRGALEVMAQSDRYGCALGAAVALVLDWQAIRAVLDLASERMALVPAACLLPGDADTAAMLDGLPDQSRLERTLVFGGRQLLATHWGLWDILEARAGARDEG